MSEAATADVFKTADGGWRIADSRVSLDSVVSAFLEGESPEALAKEFPTLTLKQVHAALAFYLQHKSEIDEYLVDQDAKWRQLKVQSDSQHGSLLERLRRRRQSDAGE